MSLSITKLKCTNKPLDTDVQIYYTHFIKMGICMQRNTAEYDTY